jgi:hypothetical protein
MSWLLVPKNDDYSSAVPGTGSTGTDGILLGIKTYSSSK